VRARHTSRIEAEILVSAHDYFNPKLMIDTIARGA
jgi:hypothetical protein